MALRLAAASGRVQTTARPDDPSSSKPAGPGRILLPLNSDGGALGNIVRSNPEWAAVLAVVAFAFFLRVVALDVLPPSVTADEADNLQLVYQIREGGGPGLFGLDWKPAPAFSVYLMTGFMYVFGWSIAGMRMASAVLTSLSLIPFYFVARQRLSTAASLSAAFLLSTSLWYLHFSRSGWENAQVGLFSMMAAWSFSKGLHGRRHLHYGLAGVWCALGLYGYFSGRAILLSLLAYVPFAIWAERRSAKPVLLGCAFMLFICLMLFSPEIPTIARNWDYFNSRVRTVAITAAPLPYDGASTLPEVLVRQVERTVRAFLLLDGAVVNNARYFPIGQPVFDPLTGGLFLIGAATALLAWRRTALWWCLYLVPLGVTQVFSTGTPDLARAVGAAPAAFLFVGYGFDRLAPRPGSARRLLQLAVVVLLPWAAYYDFAAYSTWMIRPDAISARRPAIPASEFADWQSQQIASAAADKSGPTAGEWDQRRGELPTTVATAPRGVPTLPPPVRQRVEATEMPGLLSFQATIAQPDVLSEPRGVAVDLAGRVWVADAKGRRVVRFEADGRAGLTITGPSEGQFVAPWDVAVDSAGLVYVLDAESQAVYRFGADGVPQAKLLEKAGLYRPRGLAVDADGLLYVADTGRNRVLKVSPTGEILATFAGSGGLTFSQPTDAAVAPDGSIFVAEPAAKRLRRLNSGGQVVAEWPLTASDTQNAPHLAIAGRWLLATNPQERRVDVLSLDGASAGYWLAPSEAGELLAPMGIDARDGTVLVGDVRGGHVLRLALGE